MPTIPELTAKIIAFREERNWQKYHIPKNLILSILIELGELAELFQWTLTPEDIETLKQHKKTEIADEIADVAIYLMLLAAELNVDLEQAITEKLKKNAKKYPA